MDSASTDYLETLHQKALSGGELEENALFEALTARFRLLAANRIWDQQDALDVAQEALVIVHRKYKGGEQIPSFTGWSHKILHHKVLEYYRATSRRTGRIASGTGREDDAASQAADPELDRALRHCLRRLIEKNVRYGRILVHVYQGYDADEICSRMAITRSNFYTILSRARSLLKHCLEHGDTPS